MGQKIEIAFCARLIYSETEITGERILYPYDLHPKYAAEQTGVLFSQYVNRFRVDRAKRLLADPQSQVKLVAQQVGFENVNTFIRVFKEPLNKSPTADDGSFPPILRFEKREIHTVFPRFSNLVLTKNLSPSTAADLIRTSLRALRAFRLAFTRKRF